MEPGPNDFRFVVHDWTPTPADAMGRFSGLDIGYEITSLKPAAAELRRLYPARHDTEFGLHILNIS